MDYLASVALLRPWRCRQCDRRFYAWAAALRFVYYVHCNLCGNLDLQRVASEHGTGPFAWLLRPLGFPAYRCAPCRNRFFSIRVYRRILPVEAPDLAQHESEPVARR